VRLKGVPSVGGCRLNTGFVKRKQHRMRSELELQELLQREIGLARPDLEAVQIHFTENISTMASRTWKDKQSVLRLHRIFRNAPEDLLEDLVRLFFRRIRRRSASAIRARLKDYVQVHHQSVLRPFSASHIISPDGLAFDLRILLERVENRFFPEISPVQIAWSRSIRKRLMGKWIENPDPHPNLVLINRLLDTPEVPEYYLEFLIFHELLHEVVPIQRSSGRWIHHTREFRGREREFPAYEQALEWEDKNLTRLYRKAARARPRSGRQAGRKAAGRRRPLS